MVTTNKFEFPIGREGRPLGPNTQHRRAFGGGVHDSVVALALQDALANQSLVVADDSLVSGAPSSDVMPSASATLTGEAGTASIAELFDASNGTQGFSTFTK